MKANFNAALAVMALSALGPMRASPAEVETPIDTLPTLAPEPAPKPLTTHDTERLRLAQAKRERKAAKLRRTGL